MFKGKESKNEESAPTKKKALYFIKFIRPITPEDDVISDENNFEWSDFRLKIHCELMDQHGGEIEGKPAADIYLAFNRDEDKPCDFFLHIKTKTEGFLQEHYASYEIPFSIHERHFQYYYPSNPSLSDEIKCSREWNMSTSHIRVINNLSTDIIELLEDSTISRASISSWIDMILSTIHNTIPYTTMADYSEPYRHFSDESRNNSLEQKANEGDAPTLHNLGNLYYDGHGIEKGYAKAKGYFEKTEAKENNDDSDVSKDDTDAKGYYEPSNNRNNLFTQNKKTSELFDELIEFIEDQPSFNKNTPN
jgi:hypothetical protein